MKTNNFNHPIFGYILESIDNSGYSDQELKTEAEKLQFLYNTFIAEYWHEYNKKYYKGNIYKCFESWLMGLPGCFNIVFSNYDIIELYKKHEGLKELSDKQAYKIIDNYWNFITVKTFQLFKRYKIVM